MKIKKLLDFYKNPLKVGPFYDMFSYDNMRDALIAIGINTEDEAHKMDFMYLYNHSGMKTLSNMLKIMLTGYIIDDDENIVYSNGMRITWEGMVSEIDTQIIQYILHTKFHDKWKLLSDTLNMDYDVLKPYQMQNEENSTDNLTSKGVDTGSGTTKNTGTNSADTTSDGKDNIYGFNSSDAVPADTNSNTVNTSGNSSDNGEYTRENTNDYSRDSTNHKNSTRSGNIGNKTAPELIEEQRELLQFQIFDIIFQDLDTVLTRSMYN